MLPLAIAATCGNRKIVEDLLRHDADPNIPQYLRRSIDVSIFDSIYMLGKKNKKKSLGSRMRTEKLRGGGTNRVRRPRIQPHPRSIPAVVSIQCWRLHARAHMYNVMTILFNPPPHVIQGRNTPMQPVSPMYHAAGGGHYSTVRMLLKYGANPNVRCDKIFRHDYGETPLAVATAAGQKSIVR